MNKRFWFLFFLVLSGGFLLKIFPFWTNQFFFTMDQGNDAVYVREILAGRIFPLVGPETSAYGVYHGVLWYYFIAVGIALFGGHPFGAVFMLVLLNSLATGVLMWYLFKKVSPWWALVTGGALQVFWGFYVTSQYAFNPFPLAALTMFALVLFLQAEEGKKRAYLWAAIPVGFTIHAHIVAAIPIILWYIAGGLLFWVKRRTTFINILLGMFVVILFLTPHMVSEVANGFHQTHAIQAEFSRASGFFIRSKGYQLTEFLQILGSSVFPQVSYIGSILLATVFITAFVPFNLTARDPGEQRVVRYVVGLTLLLVLTTFLWYATNSTWRSWQTVYLPPLLFVSCILALRRLPKLVAIIGLVFLLATQGQYFWYRLHSDSPGDPSLLATELRAVDWVYQKSEGKGFSVYFYLPSVLDYPYQYLIWWYGKKTYGYLPCEYASYPGSPKLFIPGSSHYEEPKKPCTNLRYLIVEPDPVVARREAWLAHLTKDTNLEEKDKVGDVMVEKRSFIPQQAVY